jgi:PAS domain S-box-containing protein
MRTSPLQAGFFDQLADPQGMRVMFDHLPDVFMFAKDSEGRFMAANTAFCLRYGLKQERELIGEPDEKFVPHEVAEAYREDDRRVIRSGRPIFGRLELFYDAQHRLDWFITTKLPLHDRRGRVIGVMGMIRRDQRRLAQHDLREVSAAMQFAREHRREAVTTAALAKAIHVSERQLQRRLQTALSISPSELLMRARIQSAAEELASTSKPIIEIAMDHGFCDQSAFTLQFRKRTGLPPREFRLMQQGRAATQGPTTTSRTKRFVLAGKV